MDAAEEADSASADTTTDVDELVEASGTALNISNGPDKEEQPAPAAKGERTERNLRDPIFWIDLEMSGLDPMEHTILEVAIIATDGSLNRTIEGPSLCIHHDDDTLASMNDWSREQHEKSGLTQRCRESTVVLADAEAAVVAFVSEHAGGRPAVLGGACVYVDQQFVHRRMPALGALLSHRVIDVSTIRQLAWRWHPTVARAGPKGESSHRALDDVRYSIAELRYFRDSCWKPPERSRGRRNEQERNAGGRKKGYKA